KIQQLSTALGIDSVARLKQACVSGELRTLKGFGEKTEQKILEGIERWERRDERVRLIDALEDVEPLVTYLANHPGVTRVELAGSLRRWKETAADADFVVASDDPAAVIAHLLEYSPVVRTVEEGERDVTVRLSNGLHVELHV